MKIRKSGLRVRDSASLRPYDFPLCATRSPRGAAHWKKRHGGFRPKNDFQHRRFAPHASFSGKSTGTENQKGHYTTQIPQKSIFSALTDAFMMFMCLSKLYEFSFLYGL